MNLVAIVVTGLAIVALIANIVLATKDENINIWVEDKACLPERAHKVDAGLDLKSPVNVTIPKGGSVAIDTKTHIEIPRGYFGKLESKSGLNVKHGVVSLGGVIDSGYRGSIVAKLYNMGNEDYEISKGDKIVQLIIQPCMLPTVKRITEEEWDRKKTERGEKGFGSTGK